MNKQKVPKLRFPEFTGEWEEKKLGELTTYVDYRGKTPSKTDFGIFLITAKNIKFGYINYETSQEFISVDDYSKVMSRGLPKIGDVLFTTEAPMGNVAQVNNEKIALAQRVIKFRGKEKLKNTFLKYYLLNDSFQKKLKQKAIGTTVLGIQGKVLHKIILNIPGINEQEKIADFLTLFDKEIELEENKLELLKENKKGYMQKIFSQELRFKDGNGNDYPQWEEKRLGEVLNYEQPTKYIVKSTDYLKAYKTPVLTAGKSFILGYTNENNFIFQACKNFPVIIFDDFTTAYKFVDFNFKVKSSAMKILKPKNTNENMKFIFEAMATIKIDLGIDHKRYWISEYSFLKIPYPSLPEQEKIADFLSAADEEIELMENKIEKLKGVKKGLLQQMFI